MAIEKKVFGQTLPQRSRNITVDPASGTITLGYSANEGYDSFQTTIELSFLNPNIVINALNSLEKENLAVLIGEGIIRTSHVDEDNSYGISGPEHVVNVVTKGTIQVELRTAAPITEQFEPLLNGQRHTWEELFAEQKSKSAPERVQTRDPNAGEHRMIRDVRNYLPNMESLPYGDEVFMGWTYSYACGLEEDVRPDGKSTWRNPGRPYEVSIHGKCLTCFPEET